jgi:hypothetical protein
MLRSSSALQLDIIDDEQQRFVCIVPDQNGTIAGTYRKSSWVIRIFCSSTLQQPVPKSVITICSV